MHDDKRSKPLKTAKCKDKSKDKSKNMSRDKYREGNTSTSSKKGSPRHGGLSSLFSLGIGNTNTGGVEGGGGERESAKMASGGGREAGGGMLGGRGVQVGAVRHTHMHTAFLRMHTLLRMNTQMHMHMLPPLLFP